MTRPRSDAPILLIIYVVLAVANVAGHLLAPYLAVWAAMVALLAGQAGELFVPVAVYGLLLVAMAGFALGVRRVAIGIGTRPATPAPQR